MRRSKTLLRPLFLFPFLTILFSHVSLGQLSDFKNYNFHKPDSIAANLKSPITNLKGLSESLTNLLSTDVEKFRAIYKWVCNNIENDYDLYLKNKRMRKKFINDSLKLKNWNREFHAKVVEKLVKENKTICTGYAYLIKELAYFANIDVEIINGYGRTIQSNIGGDGIPNHSWNAVRLNNKWYLCDATWSSGSINPQQSFFIKSFNKGYFLSDPELFIKNHYPLDTSWMLLRNKPSLYDFLNGPIVYKGAFNQQLLPTAPFTFHSTVSKGDTLTFKFDSPLDCSQKFIEIQQIRNNTVISAPSKIYRDNYGHYCIDQTFNITGSVDLHILFDDEYVVSYAIKTVK